jgi:hypothetical protein
VAQDWQTTNFDRKAALFNGASMEAIMKHREFIWFNN